MSAGEPDAPRESDRSADRDERAGARSGDEGPRVSARSGASLCPRCAHVRVLESDRGSRFYLCQLSRTDARFVRYPPQPVLGCEGFEG